MQSLLKDLQQHKIINLEDLSQKKLNEVVQFWNKENPHCYLILLSNNNEGRYRRMLNILFFWFYNLGINKVLVMIEFLLHEDLHLR